MKYMTKLAAISSVGVVLAASSAIAPAAAHGRPHPPMMEPMGMRGHFGHHRHGPYFIGYYDGYYGDAYDYGYGGCGVYRHRWHETGRSYWRRRYEECLDG